MTWLWQTFPLNSPSHLSKHLAPVAEGAPLPYQTVSVSRNFTAARISCPLLRCVGLSRAVLHSVVCGTKAV